MRNPKFPAWNNSDAQHIAVLFPLSHKGDRPYSPSRKKLDLTLQWLKSQTVTPILDAAV